MLRLKELRKHSGMNQQQLAKKLGVTQATLSGWENEKYEIDNNSLLKCAKIFDVSADYLLGTEVEPEEIKIARAKTAELCKSYAESDFKRLKETTGTSVHTLKAWCSGFGDYFNDKLHFLADYFNVSVDYLLGRDTKPTLDEQLDGVDFALYGEIHDLTDDEKEDILSYIKFKKSQRGE